MMDNILELFTEQVILNNGIGKYGRKLNSLEHLSFIMSVEVSQDAPTNLKRYCSIRDVVNRGDMLFIKDYKLKRLCQTL